MTEKKATKVTKAANAVTRRTGFSVGQTVFIRSVTYHLIGIIKEVCELSIVMTNCVWVADDGRFSKLMAGEWDSTSEREIYQPDQEVQAFYGAMTDAAVWPYAIPTDCK